MNARESSSVRPAWLLVLEDVLTQEDVAAGNARSSTMPTSSKGASRI